MKAIYINIDPYLAAFAAWLKGGKVGTKPDFQPLPLAVTVPLGQDVAIYVPFDATGAEEMYNSATVNGQTVLFCMPDSAGYSTGLGDKITDGESAFSALAPSAKYSVYAVSGSSASVTVTLNDDGLEIGLEITFTVLVRRETASGPVDLVDWTPPAAAPSAADIKSALVAAGEKPLEGVSLGGARIVVDTDGLATIVSQGPSDGVWPEGFPLQKSEPSDLLVALGSTTAS